MINCTKAMKSIEHTINLSNDDNPFKEKNQNVEITSFIDENSSQFEEIHPVNIVNEYTEINHDEIVHENIRQNDNEEVLYKNMDYCETFPYIDTKLNQHDESLYE